MALTEGLVGEIYNAVVSLVAGTGEFDTVLGHEPLSLPTRTGLAASVWGDELTSATGSGLHETSALMLLSCRIQRSATAGTTAEMDALEVRMLSAASAVITALLGNLTLGGLVRTVDPRGISGVRLRARGGYFEQDRVVQRVSVITIPIIINDAWGEVA
jgi:hypothetical protein